MSEQLAASGAARRRGIESRHRLVGRGDRHREAMATLAVPTTSQTGGDSEAKFVTHPRGEKSRDKEKGHINEPATSEETITTGSTRTPIRPSGCLLGDLPVLLPQYFALCRSA